MQSSRQDWEAAPYTITVVAHDVGPPGGMELQLARLVSGLLERGHQVVVVARRCEIPSHPRLRWLRVRGPRRPFPLAYLWFFVLGSWLVWRHRQGVVNTMGAVVANKVDVATIPFCHLGFRTTRLIRATRKGSMYLVNARIAAYLSCTAERWCYRPAKVRMLVPVSTGLAREILTHFPRVAKTVEIIPNGVDGNVFKPMGNVRRQVRGTLGIPTGAFVALFVGGDWERKGLVYAIGAIAGASGGYLLVIGPGDAESYGEIAGDLGITEQVVFVGQVRDTAAYYAAADVFVFPTAYETFSLATYEAASSGLPLLVTRVSGVEDILTDGENGWFIERNADSIARRLRLLQGDERLRRAMGAKSRLAVTGYSWERMVDYYESLFRRLVQSTDQPADKAALQSRAR